MTYTIDPFEYCARKNYKKYFHRTNFSPECPGEWSRVIQLSVCIYAVGVAAAEEELFGNRNIAGDDDEGEGRGVDGGLVVSERRGIPEMYVSCSNRGVRHGGYPTTAACRQIFYQVGRGKDKYVTSVYFFHVKQ